MISIIKKDKCKRDTRKGFFSLHSSLFALSLLLLAATVTSCGLYQKYERPETKVMDENIMRNASQYANTTDSTGFGDVAWREVFTDPQLQALIQEGLENNDDIFTAAANIQKMEAALSCSRLAFLPSVAFSPQGTLSKVLSGDYKSDWSKSYTLPVSASWTVDLFGNLLSQKRGTEMQLEMMKDYEQLTRSMVICGIANAYYTLLMLDRQLEILDEMDTLTNDTYEMMKLQKELRGARETAVVSAEASLLSVRSQKIDMQRQVLAVENNLSLLIGRSAQSIKRGKLADQNMPNKFSTGLAVNLLAARPDVHAAEMNLANCFYAVETARSKFYPQLTITGTGAYTNNIGQVVNPGQWLANFVGQLVQPIFQNGRIKAGLKVAQLEYEVAYRNWEHSILSAGAEVSNALVEYNSAKAKGEVDRQQVEVLTKSVDYTKELFQMGSSSYLEVLQAQSQLLNAKISQVTDDFNKMQAVVNLYSALGGGRK